MLAVAVLLTLVGFVTGCGDDDEAPSPTGVTTEQDGAAQSGEKAGKGAGVVVVDSQMSVDEAFSSLVAKLEKNPDVTVVASIDHTANAQSVGMDLPPIREVIFGNPKLGTPLMQSAARAGLDLPQKVLVYEDGSGATKLAYNDPAYVTARHAVRGVEDIERKIATALGMVAGEGEPLAPSEVSADAGVVEVSSSDSVQAVFDRLTKALDENPKTSVVAQVDHTFNAESVDMDLPPIRELIFGNPALGTPLMQANARAGLDLPQKILVYEGPDGETTLAYNDPSYITARHGADVDPEVIEKISMALEKITAGAAGGGGG